MKPSTWMKLLGIATAAIAFFWIAAVVFPWLNGRAWIGPGILLLIVATSAFSAVGYYSRVLRPKDVLIDKYNGNLEFVYKKRREWKSALIGYVVAQRGSYDVEKNMSVSPVTDNPKVRKILYDVQLRARLSSEESFRQWFEFLTKDRRIPITDLEYMWACIKKVLEYELYEFQNARSKEIAELYNPLDQKQQQKFEELVISFLSPTLKGLEVQPLEIAFHLAA